MIYQSSQNNEAANNKALLSFLIFVFLFGLNPIAIRIGYQELAPFWLTCLRYALSASAFWAIVLFKKHPIPSGRALLGSILYGVLGMGFSSTLYAWGLVKTPAGLTSVLMALVPLLTVFLSTLQRQESLIGLGILGSMITILGTTVAVRLSGSADISGIHIAAIILSAAFLAQSGVTMKHFPSSHPISSNAIAATTGALIQGITSLLAGEPHAIPALPSTWAALAFLIALGTVIGFVLYLKVLQKWAASATNYSFVLSPIITVIVASALTGEQVTLKFLIGSALVLLGAGIGALLPHQRVS